jgi:hypothetical protein
MRIEEITLIDVKLPNKKRMKEIDYWNLNRPYRRKLREAVRKCLSTGEEQFFYDEGIFLYHARPEFPLIESAMLEPDNQSLMKVSITVYSKIRHLGVRDTPEKDVDHKGIMYTEAEVESKFGISRTTA